MPTPKLRFQEQKAPKSGRQYNFQEHTSKHIPTFINKSGCQTLQENHWAFYHTNSAQLRTLFLLITLDCPLVQSFQNGTANFRVHTSLTFLINGDERPLLMGCFLKRLKRLLFTGDGFAGVRSIDSAMLSLEHKTFLQMVP